MFICSVYFSHLRPRDGSPENCLFQMSSVHVHPHAYICIINENQKANSLIWENKIYKLKKSIVKFLFLFFFFGVWYWNVGRNHTHTLTHTKKSESWHGTHAIYNYIKIKCYFLSFFLSFFFRFETLLKTSQTSCTLHDGTILKKIIICALFIFIYLFISLLCALFS